jgi:hypothetical protein
MESVLRKTPWWAPVAVLILAWCIGRTQVAHDLWSWLHLLGGAALAFFFLGCIDALRATHPLARYAVAFAFACTGALGWELMEFGIDQVWGTHLQEGLLDTMTDLMLGVSGAALYLGYAALPRGQRKPGEQAARRGG